MVDAAALLVKRDNMVPAFCGKKCLVSLLTPIPAIT
jgi:hypothetical protein